MSPGIITVRQPAAGDLEAAAGFCNRARAADPSVEPFAPRLAAIAGSPRALLDVWRVGRDDDGVLQGIAFAALRETRRGHVTADAYAAVAPAVRRRGLGRALCEPALRWAAEQRATLRARVHEDAVPGHAFLRALGFSPRSAQLLLRWSASPIEPRPVPSLRIRALAAGDHLRDLERLSRQAWAGAPDGFAWRFEELAQLFAEAGKLVLLAEADRRMVGYLAAVWQGRTLGIEEVAVLPEFRRAGIGRALLSAALAGAGHAALSVVESNRAARALYGSLGFTQSARRIVYELAGATKP